MSLYNKFQIWLSITFLILTTSVFGLLLHSSHTYLKTQQKIEMTNMISALNIALTPFIHQKDKVGLESVINASFDSGFYGSITLKINDSNTQIQRKNLNQNSDSPEWFQKIAPFEELTESRVLMDGWMQAATLTVTNNTATGYDQLWALTLRLLTAFIINSLLAAISMIIILRVMFKPLKDIQKRANEISLNKFGDPIPQVNTRELSDVIQAINYMSKHIEAHYLQSANEVKRLRMRAYQDPVSELSNREYFITQLEPWLTSNTHDHCGLWLMKVDAIEDAYENKEFDKADSMVKELAQKLSSFVDGRSTFSRFSRSEFILLVPHCHYEYLEQVSETALNLVNEWQPNELIEDNSASIGMMVLHHQTDMRTVFTQLDSALTQARQQSGLKAFYIMKILFLYNENTILPEFTKGKMEWQNFVKQGIENQQVKIRLQPAINKEQQILHYEAFAYIEVDNIIYTANHFITALEDSDVAYQFDNHVLTLVSKQLAANPSKSPITVNISKDSLHNSQFVVFLTQMLKANPQLRDAGI
ncbi:LapD/MoxY N-terminal periplasmic domain-containing protein [Vibrio rumoiensis]|uniref:LapD/MoxY N-terminal periplasmic domain-containing protein n=1 Tax=Vibrio rumoiensis TaxID=76258 RepID=UPI000D78475F|nr:LapD/MoxY N-terminal periplasmic domain-containing protein [Vibrio rumoiensis]